MKNISNIGSCVTRDILNFEPIKKEFNVNFYAFQVNVWDMFSPGIELEQEIINNIPIANFYRKMLDLDVNKKIIPELSKVRSEYIIIDLYVLCKEFLEVSYKNKSVFINNNACTDIYNYFQNKQELGVQVSLHTVNDLDDDLVKDGLKKFANYLIINYKIENIIIMYPVFNEKYENKDGIITPYQGKELELIKRNENIVYKYTDYLKSLLPHCKILLPKLMNKYCVTVKTDQNISKPNSVHCNMLNNCKIANQLLELMGKPPVQEIDLLSKEYSKLNIEHFALVEKLRYMKDNLCMSLNSYVDKFLDLKKHIVIVSVKHEAATKLHKFYNKNKLGLNLQIEKAQSYIGIINVLDNFKYEKSSNDCIAYIYKYKNLKIDIISAGAHCGNTSSIKINGNEYSENRRGLNIVIINNETLEIVGNFFCDTYADDDCIISLHNNVFGIK